MQFVIGAAGSSPSLFLHEIRGVDYLSWVIGPDKAIKFPSESQAKDFITAINPIAKTGLYAVKYP